VREALDDLGYAWRQLRRTPSFTVVAILTLALGIGANTTFYALIDAVVWRPARAVDFRGIFDISLGRVFKRVPGDPPRRTWEPLTAQQLAHLESDPSLGIAATAMASRAYVTAQTTEGAVRTELMIVSGDYANVYRMQPLLGRLTGLQRDSAVAGPVVVISENLWRRLYRSDPAIVGREPLRVNGRAFTIAGVARREQAPLGADAWIASESWYATDTPDRSFVFGLARFRPDTDVSKLRARIDASLAKGPAPPAADLKTSLSGPATAVLSRDRAARLTMMVVGLSTLVLIAACANLANMLYARSAVRTGEIAVRLSLGAGTLRIFRLFLFEASIIAAFAAALGIAMAVGALRWVADSLPDSYARASILPVIEITPDWRLFAYAAIAGLMAAALVGGLTAWRGSRVPPLRTFGASGIAASTPARAKWTRTLLVAVQVSAAVILLLGTSLYLVRALTTSRTAILYDTAPLATAQLSFDNSYRLDQAAEVMGRVLDRMKQIDGVKTAAIANGLIGGSYAGGRGLRNLVAEDESMPGRMSTWRTLEGQQAAVSPEFFAATGIQVVSGRSFTTNDRDGAPDVVMLSQSAAANLWPGLDPLGKRVRLANDPRWATVIGIFADPLRNRADDKWACLRGCVALAPWLQKPGREWLVILRADEPAAAAQQIVRAVAAVDERVPVFSPSVADRGIFAPSNPEGVIAGLFGALGVLSLAIAALGIYGVISYSVSRRTREFGIRLALGATPRGILRAVLDDAVHLVLVGLLPGVLLASWSTRVLEASIVSLMPNDIPTWAAVPIGVLVIGVFAAYIPARRAARVDPNVALRDL